MSRTIIGIVVLAGLAGCDQEDTEDPVARVSEDQRDVAWARDAAGRYQDPVCGHSILASSPWKIVCRGRLYYFHSADCRTQFCENPLSYTDAPADPDRPR